MKPTNIQSQVARHIHCGPQKRGTLHLSISYRLFTAMLA